jgi:hypothetical protein
VRYRYDPDSELLRVGERRFPVSSWRRYSLTDDLPPDTQFMLNHPDYRMETRQAIVPLENTWALSVIWGDATYSDNHIGLFTDRQPFVEEPATAEVGILMPGDGGLWGEPLGYVLANLFPLLVERVSQLPSQDPPPPLTDGGDVVTTCDYIELLLMERSS